MTEDKAFQFYERKIKEHDVARDAGDEHREHAHHRQYRRQLHVVLVVQLPARASASHTTRGERRAARTWTQNPHAMKLHQFTHAIVCITANLPFARVHIERRISGGGAHA